MKLEFHPEAELELIEEAAYYELLVPGLGGVDAFGLQDLGQVALRVLNAFVRREKMNAICVVKNQIAHSRAKNRTNQDIGIQHQRTTRQRHYFLRRRAVKSATTSSVSSRAALSKASSLATAAFREVSSAAGPLSRLGM